MSYIRVSGRQAALSLAAMFAIALTPATAHAGFFDQLFGGGMAPQQPIEAPAQSGYSQDPTGLNSYRPARTVHVKKKVVVVAATVAKTPLLQKTTDLMSDKTLRTGDAVMMKTGVQIYDGPQQSRHDADQFVALGDADHLKAKTRDELLAMDVTRRNPLVFAAATSSVQEGRSAATGQPVATGYKITDAHGRSIRYVGP